MRKNFLCDTCLNYYRDVRKKKKKNPSHICGVLLKSVQMDPVRGEEKTSLTLCTVHW